MKQEAREEIIGLLPFYLSGRISPADRALVERWIESDAEAPQILAKIEEERGAVITSNEAIQAPAGGLARLMEDVRQTPQEMVPSVAAKSFFKTIAKKIALPFEVAPKELAWGLCGLLLMISAVQTGLIYSGSKGTTGPGFELASGEKMALAGRAIVMFQTGVKLDDVQALLNDASAVIIEGPTASGQFIVGFERAETLGSLDERFAKLEKASSIVSFISLMGER